MSKSSKKRERTADEDVADSHDAKPAVKKSKLDKTGKSEVTKKSAKVKEAKDEPVEVETPPKAKKEKKDKADKTDKKEKKERKEKKEKSEKKEKKRKSKDVTAAAEPEDEPAPESPNSQPTNGEADTGGDKRTSSKEKKNTKKDKKTKTKTEEPQPQADEPAEAEAEEEETTSSKANRFIVFVGNLPFSATADSVRAHFASVHPASVRLLTQRDDPRKSRGVAFVEFGRYDHMKTCLEKFHHSEFDDGTGSAAGKRRINVELTAGGGGKTAKRQDKIKQKNAKLNEERAQRMKKEEEAKQTKAAKSQEQRDEDAIHPSRRARVPYNGRQ